MKINLKPAIKFVKRHSHQIAAVIAGAGVIVTAIEAGKAGARINAKISAIEASRGEPLTTKEKIEVSADEVIVPVITGAVTVGAIATGAIASEKMIVGLATTGTMIAKRYSDYQTNVQTINPTVDKEARAMSAKEKVAKYIKDYDVSTAPEDVLYYDTHTGQVFHGRPNLPLIAEKRIGDILLRKGRVSENEYRIIMGELTDPIGGDYYGWDQFSFFDQDILDDNIALQINEEIAVSDDGLEYRVLYLSKEPDADFMSSDASYITSAFDVR